MNRLGQEHLLQGITADLPREVNVSPLLLSNVMLYECTYNRGPYSCYARDYEDRRRGGRGYDRCGCDYDRYRDYDKDQDGGDYDCGRYEFLPSQLKVIFLWVLRFA